MTTTIRVGLRRPTEHSSPRIVSGGTQIPLEQLAPQLEQRIAQLVQGPLSFEACHLNPG